MTTNTNLDRRVAEYLKGSTPEQRLLSFAKWLETLTIDELAALSIGIISQLASAVNKLYAEKQNKE